MSDMNEALTRGIESILPSKEVFKKELEAKKLSIYFGIDPTGPDLHLGHLVNFLVLKRFMNLGHKITILIGDFTARIGDPSDKDTTRKQLTKKEVEDNLKTYKDQVGRILGEGVDFKYNSKWLKDLKFEDILELSSKVTVQQMIQRKMFQKRLWKWTCPNCKKTSRSWIQFNTQENYETAKLEDNEIECLHCRKLVPYNKEDISPESTTELGPIGLHEFLYPLMQGYDSVALKTDVEVGGNDQLFNMMVGRDLVKIYLNKEKFVLTTKLLVEPESGKKMSTSEGSYVSLNISPEDVFGGVMALPDGMVRVCFELCTEVPFETIEKHMQAHPRDAKMFLAFEITKLVWGEEKAEKAREEFEKVFKEGKFPEKVERFKISEPKNILDVLVEAGLAKSKSEARRLIEGNAVDFNGEVVTDWGIEIGPEDRKRMLRVGKRRFVLIIK